MRGNVSNTELMSSLVSLRGRVDSQAFEMPEPFVLGKVVDVERRTTKGFVRGQVTIEGLGEDAGRTIRLEIQNEILVALEGEQVHAMVPDIITVIDTESGYAIQTERVRYGWIVNSVMDFIATATPPVVRRPLVGATTHHTGTLVLHTLSGNARPSPAGACVPCPPSTQTARDGSPIGQLGLSL